MLGERAVRRRTAPATTRPKLAELRSDVVSLAGTSIRYEGPDGPYFIDLAELVLPPSLAHPRFTRISDFPNYVSLFQAVAIRRVELSPTGQPHPRMLTRQIYLLRHIVDWLQSHGIYRLEDAPHELLRLLVEQFSLGGWSHALNLSTRWDAALDTIRPEELEHAFHFKLACGGKRHIETLMQPFWRQRIGWGGIVPIPDTAKHRLETMTAHPVTSSWQKRTYNESAPGRLVIRNTLGWLNDLALLPEPVDRFRHKVSARPNLSRVLRNGKEPSRTRNLSLDDAVRVISGALKMIYKIGPLAVSVQRSAQCAEKANRDVLPSSTWLAAHPNAVEISRDLGKPILRWSASGRFARSTESYTFDEVIGALHSSCAIVLGVMNARRQREVCDRTLGLRVGDLKVIDERLGIFQAQFYIEKTYRSRHTFYIGKTSADAIRLLESLKSTSGPEDGQLIAGESLFSSGLRSQHRGIATQPHFAYCLDRGRTRSLISFSKLVLKEEAGKTNYSSHMFRRFYALLYFHQYENAELRALKQHLRHLDVAMTRVYVTDPFSRPLAEQIRSKLGRDRFSASRDRLESALETERADLELHMREVEEEKIRSTVMQIIDGSPTGGGFKRVIEKLYRQLLSRTDIRDEDAASALSKHLTKRGYRLKPMLHGQCHSPAEKRGLRARCDQGGAPRPELASPSLCQACPYHFYNLGYLNGLEDHLEKLASSQAKLGLSSIQHERAIFDLRNARRLLAILRQSAIDSSSPPTATE